MLPARSNFVYSLANSFPAAASEKTAAKLLLVSNTEEVGVEVVEITGDVSAGVAAPRI